VGIGSRDESGDTRGAAHFLEHLLFKGTLRRTALQIAAEMDAVGGMANAFTTKESTCFYAKVLGRDLPLAVDIILDITTSATLSDDDIDAERTVVIEEIGMHEDDPNDRAAEAIESAVFTASPLSLPILGTRDSIANMPGAVIRDFYRQHYQPQDLAITVSGAVDHDQLVKLVRQSTEGLDWQWGKVPSALRRTPESAQAIAPQAGVTWQDWPGEQCTIGIAMPGLARSNPDRRTLDVLNEIIGGGMSSRLFQSVRERHGLAYAVHSGHSPYSDAGVWVAGAGCQPDRVADVAALMSAELAQVRDGGVTPDEVVRAKGHLSGSLVLAGEDSASRMVALGRAEVSTGELITIDEALERISSVTHSDVERVAHEVLNGPPTVAVIGGPEQPEQRERLESRLVGGFHE
jgi:predicted Zn-dependent peptidase